MMASAPYSADRPTVLVVDDSEARRYANGRILRRARFAVREASTGKAALELARDADVVLLDLQLPDMSSLEVCRRLKTDVTTAAIPVLQLTAARAAGVEQVVALEGGADACLASPVEPIVLVATVRALVRARGAEAEARRLRSWWQKTFDAIGDGVAILDGAGGLIQCNRAMATWFDGDPEHLVDERGVPRVAGLDRAPAGWPVGRALDTRHRVSSEIRLGERFLEVVADPALGEDGTVEAVVLVLKNVTDLKVSEERMADLLGREEAARRAAEEAYRLKQEFLTTVSHELRTPLNAIVGWVDLLRHGLDPESAAEAIETIARNAWLQARLISDILDVSHIVSGKMRLDLEAVDLADVIREAREILKPAAEAKSIMIESRLDPAAPTLRGDPDRLRQVVWNLLSNAIKFTPPGRRVRIGLGVFDSSLRLTVEDEGPGIAPAFLPFVFDPFRQADASTTRRHGGLGLGLAMVRHLVELHGGSVTAGNRAAESGAVFEVVLPRPARLASDRAAHGRSSSVIRPS